MGMFNDLKKLAEKIDPALAEKAMGKIGQVMGGDKKNNNQEQSSGSQSNLNLSNYDTGRTGSGRRKAVFIGINYFGTKAELKGCINDVKNVSRFVREKYEFQEVVTLTDDQSDPLYKPTKQNMVNALRWLVEGAQPNDSLFLHYSGHGSTQKDTNGDEADGHDETLCPVDFESAGVITDDEMYDMVVRPLPKGCKLTAIFGKHN